ncbi:MAG: class I SAM-dependent rRNA methyltransferase [Myxococcales bacterium]
MQAVKLELQKDLARHLRAGHPWVFRRALEKPPSGLAAGAIVDVVEKGRFVARGYYDPHSHISVRVLTLDPAEAVGPHFFRRRIARAIALRRAFCPFSDPARTDCVRLVHGENDWLPGVVVDLYGKFAVLKLYSAGLGPHRAEIVDALRGEVQIDGVYGRDEDAAEEIVDEEAGADPDEGRAPRGRVLWGSEPPEHVVVRENGVALAVDVRAGQKTGFFLDQRDNRFALRRYAGSVATALNCFSYTGGFSLALALHGEAKVTSVDRDGSALALARKNFELNGLDPAAHAFVVADVLEELAARRERGERFDAVVLDPPAYAKTQKAVPAALDGYASLHRVALGVLRPGGILATASCSARVTPEDFLSAIREAAIKSRADLTLLEERRQPADHPVRIAFPEGRYLKFFVFRRDD